MDDHTHKHGSEVKHSGNWLTGLLIGGLAGAGAMLLLAPQSGKKTRAKLQQKSAELREQTAEALGDVVEQARAKAEQVAADGREKAEELQQRGQTALDDHRERLSTVVEAGKKAVHGS